MNIILGYKVIVVSEKNTTEWKLKNSVKSFIAMTGVRSSVKVEIRFRDLTLLHFFM